jgi:epoxyqueuosine reductase
VDAAEIARSIKRKGLELGFAEISITGAEDVEGAAQSLAAWLADGRHGDMLWMESTAAKRASPKAQWPEAKSVIMVGDN